MIPLKSMQGSARETTEEPVGFGGRNERFSETMNTLRYPVFLWRTSGVDSVLHISIFFFQNQTSAEHLSWSAVFFEFAKWPELCEILSISHDTVYLDQAINLEQSRLLTHLNNIWIFLIATCLAYSWSFVVGVYEKLFSKEKSTKSNGLAGTGC